MKNKPVIPSPPTSAELLSRKQVAARLAVSTETIKRMQRRGLLKPVAFNSRLLRYRVSDVDRLIEQASAA